MFRKSITTIRDHPAASTIGLLGSLASIVALLLYFVGSQEPNIAIESRNKSLVNKSAVELISIFDDRTTLQGEELVDELYKENWIKFYYPLQEAKEYYGEVMIILEPFTEDQRFMIIAYFDSNWKKTISTLNKGELVAVLGKIKTITSSTIVLVDSEIIEASEKMKATVGKLRKLNKPKIEKLGEFVPRILAQIRELDAEEKLGEIRQQNEVRSLISVESGKKLSDTPPGTYFFMSPFYLRKEEDDYRYSSSPINRFPTSPSYFELHKLKEGQLNIIGYVNSFHIPYISVLDGTTKRQVAISPNFDGHFDTLVILPMSRVVASSTREIEISENEDVLVLDLVVR